MFEVRPRTNPEREHAELDSARGTRRYNTMIVYGDPHYKTSLSILLARLNAQVSALLREETPSLDDVRALLIQVGQMEQGVADAAPTEPSAHVTGIVVQCQTLTDCAADAFMACWAATQSDISLPQLPQVSASLARLEDVLRAIPTLDLQVTVKLPEGFAFYALYPEQYCVAALRWLNEHCSNQDRAVVMGVRSIGTSLSALVLSTLKAAGWKAHRLTVRPTGHPFERQAQLEPSALNGAKWALIVDEGPGLSGSSMAAVAQALSESGLDPERISFLPGHSSEPGAQASPQTREWWARTPRYVVPSAELRWHGRTLTQVLAERTTQLYRTQEPVERVEDWGGGLWRQFVYENVAQCPPSAAQFERPKYCCVLRDGSAVVWQFAGLAALGDDQGSAAEAMRATLAKRAADGWTVPPLGTFAGFVATPYIEGKPLTRDDRSDTLLHHIGRYIASVAGLPLALEAHAVALQRLQEVLYCNTHEALGQDSAERALQSSGAALQWLRTTSLPTYGDGRLAPHEWVRAQDGRILKVDSFGHDYDHTIVGPQTIIWDIAGALVEWDLDETSAAPLLVSLSASGLQTIPEDVLRFYRMAYTAFRLGMFTQCAYSVADGSDEGMRLKQACAFYCQGLTRLVADWVL